MILKTSKAWVVMMVCGFLLQSRAVASNTDPDPVGGTLDKNYPPDVVQYSFHINMSASPQGPVCEHTEVTLTATLTCDSGQTADRDPTIILEKGTTSASASHPSAGVTVLTGVKGTSGGDGIKAYAKATGDNSTEISSDYVVLEVAKLDTVQINANSTWHDVTGASIVVLKGTKYTFEAVPAPSGVSWPSGEPVWSGVASGSGDTKDITFDSTGTKTLTAKCCSSDAGKNVTIDVIVPQIDELVFDNSYDIYDGTERWRRARTGQTGENEPGAFKHGEKTQVRVKFWHEKNLTYATEVTVFGDVAWVDQNAPGDNYAETTMTFGTSWPSPGDLIESEVSTVSSVAYDVDVDIDWKYKVAFGTASWIAAGSTDTLVYYIVWDSHKNGTPNASSEAFANTHYTKTHIDDACEWGDGGTSEDDLADTVCSSVHRSSVPGNVTHTVANVWGLHDTSDGDCDDLACEMAYVMRCLGVEFYQALANLRPAILSGSPYKNGVSWCTDHGQAVTKVGVSWTANNFQGCAYRTAAAANTICWDPQHNNHQKEYWELGNDKANSADAPGSPPRYGILYNYHWFDGDNSGSFQQVVAGNTHDGCTLDFTLPGTYEFHGN